MAEQMEIGKRYVADGAVVDHEGTVVCWGRSDSSRTNRP